MKKDPVKMLVWMDLMLGAFVLFIGIIHLFAGQKMPRWVFAVIFLQISLLLVYCAVRHLQKRIDTLEEKLNEKKSTG